MTDILVYVLALALLVAACWLFAIYSETTHPFVVEIWTGHEWLMIGFYNETHANKVYDQYWNDGIPVRLIDTRTDTQL